MKYKTKNDYDNDNDILNIYKYTFDNKLFLQYDNGSDKRRIIIFYKDENLKILENSKILLCEGTFYTAPKIFFLSFNNLPILLSKKIPVIYIIMQDKSEKSYEEAFNQIKTKIKKEPEFISIDFEMYLFNAFEKTFPCSYPRGCLFHLSQIISRKIKSESINFYNTDIIFKKIVKYCYFLAFVPLEKIEVEFDKTKRLSQDKDHHRMFLEYFIKFIINERKIKSKDMKFCSVTIEF
ncbi:hypothetical protein DMUE_3662 [Dictyocoela muelleri]|nr:hypothetical protein DMUE_3662 [Dictyocoela muelleri]